MATQEGKIKMANVKEDDENKNSMPSLKNFSDEESVPSIPSLEDFSDEESVAPLEDCEPMCNVVDSSLEKSNFYSSLLDAKDANGNPLFTVFRISSSCCSAPSTIPPFCGCKHVTDKAGERINYTSRDTISNPTELYNAGSLCYNSDENNLH
jgi:hypothetical protein